MMQKAQTSMQPVFLLTPNPPLTKPKLAPTGSSLAGSSHWGVFIFRNK